MSINMTINELENAPKDTFSPLCRLDIKHIA
jgi:hypothetical protein